MIDINRIDCNCYLQLYTSDYMPKDYREIHNTVTQSGKNAIACQLLTSSTIAKPGWMELGTGNPSATVLGSYIVGSRVAFDSMVRSSNVLTMVSSWAAGVGTGAITEAGTFNVVTQNTVDMYMSSSFAVINKSTGDSLVVTWTLTVN